MKTAMRAEVLKHRRKLHAMEGCPRHSPGHGDQAPALCWGGINSPAGADGAEEWGLCRGPGLIFATPCMKPAQCNKSLSSLVLTSAGQPAFILTPSSPPQPPHPQADAETPTQANTYVPAPDGDPLLMPPLGHSPGGGNRLYQHYRSPLNHSFYVRRTDMQFLIFTNNMDLAPSLKFGH